MQKAWPEPEAMVWLAHWRRRCRLARRLEQMAAGHLAVALAEGADSLWILHGLSRLSCGCLDARELRPASKHDCGVRRRHCDMTSSAAPCLSSLPFPDLHPHMVISWFTIACSLNSEESIPLLQRDSRVRAAKITISHRSPSFFAYLTNRGTPPPT